jgi:hypothetical protein
VGLLGVTPAASQSPTSNELLLACSNKAKELEAEVQSLREQLRTCAGQGDSSPALARSTRSSRAELAAASAVARRSTARARRDACSPPYDFDEHGLKYYKPECLDSDKASSCLVPFEFSNSGIKSFKPGCLEAAPSPPTCDPPYELDPGGMKTFKRECL